KGNEEVGASVHHLLIADVERCGRAVLCDVRRMRLHGPSTSSRLPRREAVSAALRAMHEAEAMGYQPAVHIGECLANHVHVVVVPTATHDDPHADTASRSIRACLSLKAPSFL